MWKLTKGLCFTLDFPDYEANDKIVEGKKIGVVEKQKEICIMHTGGSSFPILLIYLGRSLWYFI